MKILTKAKAVSAGFFCLLFFLLSSGFASSSEDANSPPDFILNPAEISVLEDSPLQTVAVVDVNSIDWGEGDPEQEVQEFIVTVPPEDIALFSELPAIDNNGTLSFRPASDANGTSSVSVVLRDNGGTANGGIDFSEEKTLVIEIRNVNDPPDFVLNPSEISVLEDALLQTLSVVDVSAINWGEGDPEQEVQEFIVTVPPEDIAMFSELPAIDNNGTLSFRPASDANGTSSVSVVLRDNGGTANGGNDLSDPVSLTIVVDPVNDKPDFSFSQDILANNEDDGIQEISGFIQNISFGPENESSQTVLEYHIEVDNNDLFSQLPDISESGVLTYELSSDQYGTARVKVRLQDNGGTLNGGSDLSDEHEFSINVSPVNDRPIFQLAEESISLSEDSSPFAFSGFAEVITLGENETNQEVKEYVLTVYESENASLFSAGPVLSKNGELSFTLAADRFGEAEIAVQLFDDGGTSGGGVDSSLVQTFAVRVLPVNDAPTFEILKTQVEQLEDDGAVVIENFAHSVHLGNYESGQQVKQFELVFSEQTNPMLFVNVPEITQEGTLRFELAADQSGSVKVGARLRDDGGVESGGVDLSGEKSFDIVVQPVNDAPSFDLLISQLASVEDGGSVEQAGVIGNIFLGELETGQELESVLVEPSHPEFFSVQPQISAEGLLTFTLAPDRFGAVDLVVRVKDTGGTGNGGVDISQPQTMHLNVLPVNDRPVFSLAAATITLNEDHGNYSFADFLIEMDLGAYETEQQVEEIVVSEVSTGNNLLFASVPSITNAGDLSFALQPNQSGESVFSVVLKDNGGTENGGINTSAEVFFTVVVNEVNDKPSFELESEILTVLEDQLFQTVSNFVKNIDWGENENQQVEDFLVVVDNPGLFAVLPDIDLNGELNYQLKSDYNGSSGVTVRLMDSGGTENGGQNISDSKAFSVNVLSVNDLPSFELSKTEFLLEEDEEFNSLPGFVTSVDFGAFNETEQQVSEFLLNASNTSLFRDLPNVTIEGTLLMTLEENQFGSSVVQIQMRDNGGVENGGMDLSAVKTFSITVLAKADAPSISPALTFEDQMSYGGLVVHKHPGDGNEVNFIKVTGITNGRLYRSDGVTEVQNGEFVPILAASQGFRFMPSPDFFGEAYFYIQSSLINSGGGQSSEKVKAQVVVQPVADMPFVSSSATEEDMPTVDGLEVSRNEVDGSEVTHFQISNIFGGRLYLKTQPGVPLQENVFLEYEQASIGFLFVPSPDFYGEASFQVQASVAANSSGLGGEKVTAVVSVSPVADTPQISDATTKEDQMNTAGLVPVRNGVDGDEVAFLRVSQITNGRLFTFDGSRQLFDSQFVAFSEVMQGFKFLPAENYFGSGSFVVQASITDEESGLGGDIAVANIFIEPVNDAPAFVKGGDISVREDEQEQVVPWATEISPGPDNESTQSVRFEVSTDKPELFEIQPEMSPAGEIRFQPKADQFGEAVVSVTIIDDGAANAGNQNTGNTERLTIAILSVNDAPNFVSGGNVLLNEDHGTYLQSDWAAGISSGPENESGQELEFLVSTSNDSFFDELPAVDPVTGDLSFRVKADLNGIVQLTLALKDNGGTEEGGVDVSPSEQFSIEVRSVNDAPYFGMLSEALIEESSGAHRFENWLTHISAGPPDEVEQNLNFQLTVPDPSLFASLPELTAEGVLTFELKNQVNGTIPVNVELKDDGGTELGGKDESPVQTFDIRIIKINNAPSFVSGDDVVVLEDAGGQVVHWASNLADGDEGNQLLHFEVTTDKPELFSNMPSLTSDGVLFFTPNPQANGVASITVILKDNGGTELGGIDQSDPVTFSIEIISINDAPSFEHGGDIVMSEDAPLLSIPWATNLSDGDEGSQLLYFEVSSDNPSLFESPAAIDGSGYLTVALAPNAFGEAAMTVILKDNGGTDNGGVDQSEVVHFKITVNSVDDPPEISSFEDIVLDAGDPVPSLRFIISDVDTPLDELELSVSVDGTLLVNEDSVFIKGTGNVRHLVMKLIPGIKGTAEVTVELSDDGSTVSAAFELEVLYKELALDIPNIFTPNNDGFNDTWNIINIGLYESSTVWVYTLEGKLIHKQSGYNYESEWSAEGVESGTYLYRIELNTGKRYSGKLKIIR